MRRAAVAGRAALTAAALVAVWLLAGCFDVQSPDLFLLTRTGQGRQAHAARQRRRHDPLQRRQGQAHLQHAV